MNDVLFYVLASLACVAVGTIAAVFVLIAIEQSRSWCRQVKARRIARAEAELDRRAAEVRSTILTLAEQLGADAHEARKALIRESFLASGRANRE